MLDLVAFYGARAGTVAPINIAALADTHLTVIGNQIMVPTRCSKILGTFFESQATAGSLTSAIQIRSPSLGSISNLDICNWNANGAVVAAAQVPDNDAPYEFFGEAPIDLVPGEALTALSAVDAAAVAENILGLVWLTDGVLINPYKGRIEHVIADCNAAAVINTWSPTALAFRQALQKGNYAIVGMKATGLSMSAARLSGLQGQSERPGVLATNSPVGAGGIGSFADSKDPFDGLFRNGRLGVWGYFSSDAPPQAEVFCSVADPAISMHILLDVIRLPVTA